MLVKFRGDSWHTNPPQVTSYLMYSSSTPGDNYRRTRSLACGFGWCFDTKPRPKGVDVIFQPHKCSSALSDIKIKVKVSYPGGAKPAEEEVFTRISVKSESTKIGTYRLQQHEGAHLEITLTFNASDDLSLPTTSSEPSIKPSLKAFHHSLDGPSFVDTKFYLFSARVQGQPAIPKAIFARSQLLIDSSTYLHDLISPASGFASGTPCDLRQDESEEIAKLNPETYGYDSDSDLEEDIVPGGQEKEKAPEPENVPGLAGVDKSVNQVKQDFTGRVPDGRAFAINGTAYKTWKAFVFYAYTDVVQFNELRSRGKGQGTSSPNPRMASDPELISCSPKSMYRFADYAGLPTLKTLALEEIGKNLDASNIIAELFSVFTSRYQEIIELEVDFLINNFSPGVARGLDDMLQLIAPGSKPHCFRVLAFTMRRLLGDKIPKVPVLFSQRTDVDDFSEGPPPEQAVRSVPLELGGWGGVFTEGRSHQGHT